MPKSSSSSRSAGDDDVVKGTLVDGRVQTKCVTNVDKMFSQITECPVEKMFSQITDYFEKEEGAGKPFVRDSSIEAARSIADNAEKAEQTAVKKRSQSSKDNTDLEKTVDSPNEKEKLIIYFFLLWRTRMIRTFP